MSASASASASVRPALDAFYGQHLSWSSCGDGFQCSTLKVPLDYAHPDRRTIDISVIRLRASDSAHRIGSLVINPGGPGGSGVQYARYARYLFPDRIRARFDIVGFDPRGVGRSTPVRCLDDRELDHYVSIDPTPDNETEVQQLVTSSKEFASACERKDGWLLPYVGTLVQARDMDVLRAALGDAKLSYLGKSYGTYLGAKYAQLFPTHIRALVLDGALDPAASTEDLNRVQAKGFEVDLGDFVRWCVRASDCPLGQSATSANATLQRLAQRVDAHPIPAAGGRTLGPGEYFLALADGLYVPSQGWPALKSALAAALDNRGGPMLALTDDITERGPDGHFSNLIESNTAINCLDRPSPKDLATYRHDAAQLAAESPHFGEAIAWSSLTCAYWPVPPVEDAHEVHAKGAPPLLVIGTTRDPATPYVWAQRLAAELDSGVLLTYDGDGHTAYGRGSQCVDQAVDDYLVDLKVTPDLRCT